VPAASECPWPDLELRILPGQQDALQLAGSLQILIHALFAFGDFAVQASVFHGTGDLLGQQRQSPLMIFGEERDALAFHVENTDSAILARSEERRAPSEFQVGGDVARIGGGIEYRMASRDSTAAAGYALAQRDIVDLHALVEANAKTVAEDVANRCRP